MSLRKSPAPTSASRAANRRNAANSTGPRTAAGKARASGNALRHGGSAASDVSRQTMLALGEDPEEFEDLFHSLLRAFEPADPLWAKQVEDLAKLYWRRSRLERARDALLRQRMEEPRREHQRRLAEIEGAAIPPTEEQMLNVREPAIEDPVARLRLSLSYLQLIRQRIAKHNFNERERYLMELSFLGVASWRRSRIDNLYWQHLPAGVIPKDPVEENGHSKLLELLDEEIVEVRQAFDKAFQECQEASPSSRDALLVPISDRWETLNRQENDLQRAIDRKTRILHAHMRLRAVQGNQGEARRPTPRVEGPPASSRQEAGERGH